jgi:hypothetical protein
MAWCLLCTVANCRNFSAGPSGYHQDGTPFHLSPRYLPVSLQSLIQLPLSTPSLVTAFNAVSAHYRSVSYAASRPLIPRCHVVTFRSSFQPQHPGHSALECAVFRALQVAYATMADVGGQVNVVDAESGSLKWNFTGNDHLMFGNSRSSVAVDRDGGILHVKID